MTELERELKATIKIQEEIFKDELQKVTTAYEKSIEQISTAYSNQMKEALAVIERQSQTLSKYESISTNWQISIDEKQVANLESLFAKQRGELESLQRQLDSLERKL